MKHAATVLVLLLCTGCAGSVRLETGPQVMGQLSTETVTTVATAPIDPGTTRSARLAFLAPNGVEFEARPVAFDTEAEFRRGVLAAVISGPTNDALFTALDKALAVRSVTLNGDVADVRMSGRLTSGSDSLLTQAAQVQIAETVFENFSLVDAVDIYIDDAYAAGFRKDTLIDALARTGVGLWQPRATAACRPALKLKKGSRLPKILAVPRSQEPRVARVVAAVRLNQRIEVLVVGPRPADATSMVVTAPDGSDFTPTCRGVDIEMRMPVGINGRLRVQLLQGQNTSQPRNVQVVGLLPA